MSLEEFLQGVPVSSSSTGRMHVKENLQECIFLKTFFMGDISISDSSPPISHQEQISEWGVANQKVVTETLQLKLVVLQT